MPGGWRELEGSVEHALGGLAEGEDNTMGLYREKLGSGATHQQRRTTRQEF